MVAKASSVSHGYNAINYAVSKEGAKLLNTNLLPTELLGAIDGGNDPEGVWRSMKRRIKEANTGKRPLKNDVIRIEIAPSVEEAATLKTDEDWNKLLQEWMTEMENVANKKDEKGKPKSLDFKSSQWIAMCHFDSGKPHIHLIVNRVREDGTINKDSNIGLNATKAANAVNDQRGWKQSAEIRKEKIEKIYNDAMDCLRAMPKFDWMEYKRLMAEKNYKLYLKMDRQNVVVSYRVYSGNSYFVSSSLRKSKELTAAHILATWEKMHNSQSPTDVTRDNEQESTEEMVTYEYSTDYDNYSSISIPQTLNDILHREIIVPEEEYSDEDLDRDEEWEDELADRDTVMEKTIKVFLSLVVPNDNAVPSGGGGGVQGELSRWDGLPTERKDEYINWARQAAQNASSAYEPTRRKKPRGYYR